jgi:hypothetical protein
VGGRTEGGGEDNSDRQPHFLTIFLFISFFFLSFPFVNFTFKTKKMGNDARRSQAQQQTLTKQNAATSCKRNRRG